MKNILKINSVMVLLLLTIGVTGCISSQNTSKDKSEKASDQVISNQLKWSERMALSVMKRHPEAYQIDDRTVGRWDYVHGLVLHSFEMLYHQTKNQKFYEYIKAYADKFIDESGTIATYRMKDFNIDMVEAGNILFNLYDTTKDEKYLKAIKTLRKQLDEQPRTTDGGFWHKNRYPYQMWLDGLYMGAPFYTKYTMRYENAKNLDDIAKQFELIQKHAIDKNTGLLYHGWDESKAMAWANKETGTSPNFWSRSLGWYAMALVDVLDYFPKEHPKYNELVGYLNQLTIAISAYQHTTGLWYQVTDMSSKEGNYLEASGSAMFCYAIAKGVNKGYLPKHYKEVATKAFDGMIKELVKVEKDGEIHLTQVCAVAGLGGEPFRDGSFEYYVNEKKKDNDPKGVGPFILAAIELNR